MIIFQMNLQTPAGNLQGGALLPRLSVAIVFYCTNILIELIFGNSLIYCNFKNYLEESSFVP